jgi:hypothetical protein
MQLDWLDILDRLFEIAVFPVIGAAAMYLVAFIKAQKEELLIKTKNETAKKYIEMLDKTIVECVIATNQTYVEALKKQNAFNAEAQKKAFQLTFDAVMAILTEDAQEYLNEAVKDLTIYITTKIEAQVAVEKQQPGQ